METLFQQNLANNRTAFVACTTKADGDLSMSTVAADELVARRRAVVDIPWRVCRQIHSDRVVADSTPDSTPPVGDALVALDTGQAVAVHSADCVPLVFVHHGGAIAAAHAGWRGLERGVLESTVRALRSRGPAPIEAVVGPHISAGEYEFGAEPLRRLAMRFDPSVISATTSGSPAFDLSKAVASELARLGVRVALASPDCTSLSADRYWSYRSRAESGRFALVAWMTQTETGDE